MNGLEQIKQAIMKLSPAELDELYDWLEQYRSKSAGGLNLLQD